MDCDFSHAFLFIFTACGIIVLITNCRPLPIWSNFCAMKLLSMVADPQRNILYKSLTQPAKVTADMIVYIPLCKFTNCAISYKNNPLV